MREKHSLSAITVPFSSPCTVFICIIANEGYARDRDNMIAMGILLMVFSGINFKTEKKVADIGPLEINREQNNHVGWPTYAGGIVLIAGMVVLVAGRKK